MARIVKWDKVDKTISDLGTDVEHEIHVQREAIPLIFVPGIMGSRLRAGPDWKGRDSVLPKLRWDPGATWNMISNYSGAPAARRKYMLVGRAFSSGYLEVDNENPEGDGFHGIMGDYCSGFLNALKKHDWGPLGKIFEFPVYAFGYNWTDDNVNSGKKLAQRIKDIIAEAAKVTGHCEKVILITHSMGGLVARWASEQEKAASSILGIIHGVQPVTGAPAAYWRMKAGVDGPALPSFFLGPSAYEVTPVLANTPGGLELLPNKLHRTNKDAKGWLTVTESGKTLLMLPKSDPYEEIYRVKAVVRPAAGQPSSKNQYWGLVDPALLNPGNVNKQPNGKGNNLLDSQFPPSRVAWLQYLLTLDRAESFHDTLGTKKHLQTFCFWGAGYPTADVVELKVGSIAVGSNPYPARNPEAYHVRGFSGFLTNEVGKLREAVLQEPSGNGDGTVPASSGKKVNDAEKPFPGDRSVKAEHQPAYKNVFVQAYTRLAIIALCKMRYDELRHPVGDFPASKGATNKA